MGFTHSRDTSNYTAAPPPPTPLCPLLPVSPREGSYQCKEVIEGNANLTWGVCTVLFILGPQWRGICSSRAGGWGSACLVTIRQGALWRCGRWATCWARDQITGLGQERREWKQQDQAEHASMGNVLMNRQALFTLGRKHKSADVEQLGDIRNYGMGNKWKEI